MKQPTSRPTAFLSVLAALFGLAVGVPTVRATVLLPAGATWKYLAGGMDPGPTWTNLNYDDSGWSSGAAPLGNDLEGGTQRITGTLLSLDAAGLGPNGARYPSVVFRATFTVADPSAYGTLNALLRRDDGAAVYLNGVEIVRDGLQPGAALTDLTTANIATGNDEITYYPFANISNALVAGENILAVEVHQNSVASSDLAFDFELRADPPPEMKVIQQFPPAGSLVTTLTNVEVTFSLAATGVDAGDLLVNGTPATGLTVVDAAQYVFDFPQPTTGTVQVAFALDSGIQGAGGLPLTPIEWTYLLNTNVTLSPLLINEFMADNGSTLRDEDRDYSDWIEIANPNPVGINAAGYRLRDSANEWIFPSVFLPARSYLVVFASGKDRTDCGSLHTNFKLDAAGEYLALVAPDGTNILQQFYPAFPRQTQDISYGFVSPGVLGDMSTPTPGAANMPTQRVAPVMFSASSRTFVTPFSLVLTSATPSATIYYTTDGSVPTTASLVYGSPIPVDHTLPIRAFATQPGQTPSPVKTRAYIQLDALAQRFSSDLPIVVMENFNGGVPVQSSLKPFYLMLFEPDPRTGRTSLTQTPTVTIRAALRIRGASTAGQPKHQFKVETWNEEDDDQDVALLGLPAESDWVLNGVYFDESLIHNPLTYDFGRDVGLASPRSRFCEVFVHTEGGSLSGAVAQPNQATTTYGYYGVMSLIEFIKIAKNRVNLDSLSACDTTEPAISGGYIMRFEKSAVSGQLVPGFYSLEIADPNVDPPNDPRPAQLAWIGSYMTAFKNALMGPNFKDPSNGYAGYLEVDSAVNYMIVNELASAQDAYIRSAYLYKPRGGKLICGPLWDYDAAFGVGCCFNSCNPTAPFRFSGNNQENLFWYTPDADRGNGAHPFPIYTRMLSDPDFAQRWVDRYQELRQGLLSDSAWQARVDGYAAQIQEAQVRNFQRWLTLGIDQGFQACMPSFLNISTETWEQHIQVVKNWSRTRLAWIDSQLPVPVTFSETSLPAPAGTQVSMTTGPGQSIYYTLDGTDPRAPGGSAAPNAILLTGGSPLTVNTSVTVTARAFGKPLAFNALWNSGVGTPVTVTNWSGPTTAHFFITTVPATSHNLLISEIHYHPADPTAAELLVNTNFNAEDFEFIEFKNIGEEPVDLYGVRFVNGLEFDFSQGAVTTLAAGQRVLLVKNRAAFEARYGNAPLVAGEYGGNLDNSGERLTVENGLGQIVADLVYQDGWYVVSDGLGFSLVPVDDSVAAMDPSQHEYWRPSSQGGGTPGAPDPAPTIPVILVNEALTHPVPPAGDAIELYNPSAGEVDVGGWYLTDDRFTPKKYRLPFPTPLPAGGYRVIEESQFNPTPGLPPSFGLSSRGEEVYLFSADAAGNLTGYAHGFAFGAAPLGGAFGRYVLSTGGEDFPLQVDFTPSAANAGPRIGPLVITEIHYHPAPGGAQFVEVLNLAETSVPLFDPLHPSTPWKLAGLDYEFPTGSEIPPGGIGLIVDTDPAVFRAQYTVPAEAQIFGPFHGTLQNSGENLALQYPDFQTNELAYVTMDAVRYNDRLPWPESADGHGPSLQRLVPSAYGNDPGHWTAAAPSPGRVVNGAGAPPVITIQPTGKTGILGQSVTFTVTATGTGPLHYQWQLNGAPVDWAGVEATQPELVLDDLASPQAGTYGVVVYNDAGVVFSSNAELALKPPPTITQQPAGLNVLAGATAVFTIQATGTGPLTYQWRWNGIDLEGATEADLVITNAQSVNDGSYTVVVSDDVASVESEPADLLVVSPPVIVNQPRDVTAVVGDTVRFTVEVSGSPPFGYRWRRNRISVAPFGVGTETLTLENAQPGYAGRYDVQITNLALATPITSDVAVLTVLADSDGDGVPDDWMTQYFGHPDPRVDDLSRATDDPDGDHSLNWEEFRAGTNPTNAVSVLRLGEVKILQGGIQIEFTGVQGKQYQLEGTDRLGDTDWISLTNFYLGTNLNLQLSDPALSNPPSRFYRLRLAVP
jgi:CotH kinase protein/Chitobiase/beta-hexosaminidase C-terminal domain/Immunoglobulin domain/Lamin Tail Domain